MANKRKSYRDSINGTRGVLTVKNKDPNYVYRIVNDIDDRILNLTERGYEIVTQDTPVGDKRVSVPTKEGTPVQISVGQGKKAYLMRIKKEFYDEDQVAKQTDIDASEQIIRSGQGGDYGSVKVETK
jgi:hypothetical protein